MKLSFKTPRRGRVKGVKEHFTGRMVTGEPGLAGWHGIGCKARKAVRSSAEKKRGSKFS